MQTNLNCIYKKAFEYNDAGKSKEAIMEFKKARDIDPGSPDVHYSIGVLTGCPDSIKHYKKAIKIDSKFTKLSKML